MTIEQEIRAQIEKNKGVKLAVSEINNHLSILEGLLRNERADAQKKIDEAYQKGLNDAWEAARKLFSSMADSDIEKAFPIEWNNGGFKALINLQPQEAIEKLKAYEEKQKADDEIKVGDEVEVLNSGNKYLIAWFAGTSLCGFAHDGVTCRLQPSDVRKTGRHFDIEKILEEMRE